MEAQINTAASGASTCHNDENNNKIDKCTYEKICSSCGIEKATKVCSACTSQVKTNNIDSLPALKISDLDEYFNLGASNAKKLISDGHMVYCHDCFEIIHLNLDASKHIGINIDQTNEHTESLFNENIKLIVEDKLDDLIDQIELSSHLDFNEQSIRQFESELVGFRRRSSHFNDVKQSIREMNDIIRDDLYLDFGALAGLMEKKLNDISDRIKEKLKDAYSVVRDLQNKINEKIDILEESINNIELMRKESTLGVQEIKNKELEISSQIEQLNQELKSICEPNFNFNSCYNSTFSCSLFVDNNLYPQFNYNVDLSKLMEAIGEISVHISPSTCEPKPWTFHDQMYLNPEFEFEAMINSGIQTNGSFWVQFIAPFEQSETPVALFKKNRIRSNQVLEEISRYVRSKTISDKEWLSYEQMNLSPKQGEKCFCLDEKTRKWYRARILSVDYGLRKCHVFYVDTGFSDINQLHSFDQILPWRDFDLANLPNRAIKCLLYNNNSDTSYEQHVHQESKFLFKDLTAAKAIKCVLVEPTVLNDCLEEAWICKVYQINDEKNFQFVSVNKKIIESNKKENTTPRDTTKFASRDIRLQSVRSSKASPLSSSSSFTPQNANSTIVTECRNKFEKVSHKPDTREEFSASSESNRQTNSENEPFDTNLDYSSVLNVEDTHEENLDVEDQIAERRFFKNCSGMCHVTTSISNEGIFWIKPIIKYNLHEEFEKLSPLIDEFIRRTNYRSYGDLKIEPQLHKKCFVRTCLKKNGALGFYRGFIEKIFANREQCRVRLMDHGHAREVSYMDIYPHRRLDFNSIASNNDIDGFNDTDNHGLKLNYLSIRCCLFQSKFDNLKSKKDYFNSLISNRRVNFNLVEQVTIGNKLKCWYTEISTHNELINIKIFTSVANDSLKKSKSEGVVKQLCADGEKSSSVTTSNTNREWQPIETHPVSSNLPRSNSMYDLKENSSLLAESLDESRSIKVKSDAQSAGFETRVFNRRKKNPEWKSLPHRDEKKSTHSKYESCPLFMNEPEWIVSSDQVVNQPSFVNTPEASTVSEKDESKRKKTNRNQCRPFGENVFNWDHDRNNGNGSSSSKFSRTKANSRRARNSRSTKNNTTNQSYKGKSYKNHETDEDNSSAFNDVFFNNDNSSLDQEEFDVENRNPMNSSPNSPYNKLFKINPQVNSYEQVLSRISESESLKNMNNGIIGINEDEDELRNIRLEEAEKIRSLNLTQNSEQVINKIEAHDTSLDSMPRLIIDQTDEEAVNEPVHPTLDQTHQIPNRHIINDIETNRSIKFDQKVAHNCKNRSYSAADVALVERNRLNLKPVLVSSTSSSDISSSLTDLKKKVTDIDSDDSFESCAEEVKNYELKAKESKCRKTDLDLKIERMKKFTVSIFVDDFEADSSKNSNDSSTSLSINEVEQTRLNPNFFAVRSSCDEKKSLEEFEKNEAVNSYRRLTLDQEVFMFTGHPVQIDANRASLAARPPLGPAQLSTIVELSNECSNNTDCESKKAVSLDESSKNWISEIENNSSEFQKKIDFFNKNQDKQDIDYKNVTVRKMRRNSRDYDTLNESRRTKSASSLSDNGHVLNSLSNNCLISESFHLSGAKLNVTLETSFNSRIRHNSNNSILITDQLFEKFCQLENDQIMNESNDSLLIDLGKSNNNKFKIKSKLLNELLNEPVSLPQRSSSSPDISSYASDSLFNSHLIITPICSELVSPNQPVSIISRSISNQQSTPHRNSHSLKSPNSQSSLPPTPPQALIRDEDNNVTFSPIQKVKDDEQDFLKNINNQESKNSMSRDPNSTLQNAEVKDESKNSSFKHNMSRDPNSTLQNAEVKDESKNSSFKHNMSRDPNSTLQNAEVKDELKNAALPPAPHFPLIKPSRAEAYRSDKDSLAVSNSCPNLADRHTNKHVVNYLNTVKNSTGVDLEPVKRRSNSATRMSNFRSANFSLYGLDTEEEQETKRRSLSEGDSIDGKSCAQKISLDTSEPLETESFKFPPPPEQFMNSSTDTLPPPPDQKELEAMQNNGDNPQPTSSSSQTTIIPVKTESPRLKTFMNSLKNLQNTSPIKSDNSFKIDHLLDINPKRLYKNSKFKCRINDVLSENGRFWTEVIYNEDDERKFQEMFKYFNLHVRLAEAPKSLVKNQHVAAMYKNSWHRALVLNNYDTDPFKVKVRFLDIGLEKILDKQTDLRETEEKFFNFPIKALYCSLYVDEHVDQLTINKQLKLNKRLYLCKEARKHFVKMVYKKILYVKVIDFSQEYEPDTETFRSICKIKLGCQARHGIIDVYMYLLSKYDREKYEFLKMLKKYIQTRPVLLSMEQESVQTTTITTTETNTLSTCTTTAIPSPPESLNATLKKIQDVDSEDDCAHMENQEDNDLLDQEEDYDESDEDDVLFTDTVNYYYSKNINNKDASLDLTPVKDQHSKQSDLKITPIDLSKFETPEDNNMPAVDFSTAKVSNKLRATAANQKKSAATPIALPPATNLSDKYVKMIRKGHNSQEADTSLTAHCCNLTSLKKWAKSSNKTSNNLPKSFKIYAQEGFKENNNTLDYSLNKSLNTKKVKFQIK